MDWTDIEQRLKERVEDVCRHLLPQGKREGAEWVCGSVAGDAGRSCKVNLGGRVGFWADFAGNGGGKTLISLWCSVSGKEFRFAIKDAKEFLGIRDDFDARVKGYGGGPPKSASITAPASNNTVEKCWPKCQPLTEDGPVWRYLVGKRRIDPLVLVAYDVREMITGSQWAMVFPYWPAPATDALDLVAPMPSWLKLELLDRVDGKKHEWTTVGPQKSLWGMQLAAHPIFKAAKDLLVCEGEKDAMSWAAFGVGLRGILPCSVPFGAKWKGLDPTRPSPNRDWLDRSWPWMQRYETVWIAMDSDDAGRRAAADLVREIGPRRCRLIELETSTLTTKTKT